MFFKFKILIFSCIILFNLITSQEIVINGYKNYTTGILGNFNILISVPNGGDELPTDISDRNDSAEFDLLYTKEIGIQIRTELNALFKVFNLVDAKPFLIYNNLHRFFMNINHIILINFDLAILFNKKIKDGS
jgi:hypothetical protein